MRCEIATVQGDVSQEDIIDMVNTAVEQFMFDINNAEFRKSVHPMKYLPKILITFCL